MILRIAVVIPTYNNLRTISEVLRDVIVNTNLPILVIDDGSDTPVVNSLYSFEVKYCLEQGRVRVERCDKNQGKGMALQKAVKILASEGFTHMVTFDGDGQHFAREINKLVEIARLHPWDLVIGDRQLKAANVPGVSKFGRKFSNFWVKYETGMQVKDSQSGFRLYPLLPLQTMKFFTRRYDFEIEVLIRLMWNGIQVREIEIEVFYPEKTERVSHFNKFWDNLRISHLNALLVSVSLLKTHRSPHETALALGLGVFIGCTPFIGFHMIIAVIFALLFRLNALIIVLATHVATLPVGLFLMWGSVHIGHNWLHIGESSGAKSYFYQWLGGSMVLGGFLGLLAIGVSLFVSWTIQQNRQSRGNWTGRARGGRFGNGFLKLVLRTFGLKAGYACLYFIIPYFYFFAPTARTGLNEYWGLIDPKLSWWGRQKKIVRHFFTYGHILMDRVYQGYHSTSQFETRPQGLHHILEHIEKRTGLVLLTAHVGGWDIATTLLGKEGFKDQINVIEYQAKGLNFKKLKEGEQPDNLRTVDSGSNQDAIFEIHQAVRSGRVIALMGDRPLGDRFELIPFLGRLAPFDVTAFRLASATQAPLLYAFAFKAADRAYEFNAWASKIYSFDSKLPRPVQCYEWTKAYVSELEKFIRQHPEQWFNFYPFWSRLPTTPSGELAAQSHNSLLEELLGPPVLKPVSGPDPKPSGEE